MWLTTAFVLGFFGSLHCIGMCGPIAISLPPKKESTAKFITGRVLYNVGRILTYASMGLVFGLLGSRLKLFGLQQWASILIGAFILIYILTPKKLKADISRIQIIESFNNKVKSIFAEYMQKDSLKDLFLIGLINGLLPCGLVYIAIAGAITTGSILYAVLFMTVFGLGTAPVMFGVSVVTSLFGLKARIKIRKIVPALMVIMAVIFILRGLSLGIPFLSPPADKMTPEGKKVEMHQGH